MTWVRKTSSESDSVSDVGTLWTMRQFAHVARCALMARPGDWELRVIVDGDTVAAERCQRGSETFALADAWKRRMLDEGWRQVVPGRHPAARAVPRSSTARSSTE